MKNKENDLIIKTIEEAFKNYRIIRIAAISPCLFVLLFAIFSGTGHIVESTGLFLFTIITTQIVAFLFLQQ